MKLRPHTTKKTVLILLSATILFLSITAYLDLRSSQNLREIAKNQFNEEQIIIAKNIRWDIEQELEVIRKEIELISKAHAIKEDNIRVIENQLERSLQRLIKNGIFSLNIIDTEKKQIYSYDYSRQWKINERIDDLTLELVDSINIERKAGDAVLPAHKYSGLKLIIGRPMDQTRYVLTVELDISSFLRRFLTNTRSGKTGYAWVIDQNGTFLYHPFIEFIGKNAFTVRNERDPDINHQAINFIQKNHMLKGMEGTGSYTTGWHRGITGEIKKLIAYCPVTLTKHPRQQWFAAVVAPASEIDAYINETYLWRFLFQAVIILIIVIAGTGILFNEMRWARNLEQMVTERTLSLKKSEEKYRSLVESAEDFIYNVDRAGNFLSLNSFTAVFFGGRQEDFIGKSINHVFSEDVFQKNMKLIGLVYEHGRSIREEFFLQVGDHDLWISANFMPIREESGQVGSVLCIARDITHEKNLERQLINAEKLASVGTLAAGVAHEINNPLGVILGFTDLLVRKTPKDTQAYEDLKTIERQGMHCKQIVENLLRFARLGERKEDFSDINEEIREVVNIVAHTIEMENIDLVTDLAENIPLVKGDPRELQQVFLNLINNAFFAIKGGGILTIRSDYDINEQKAVVRVQDTGPGIKREDLDRIFEPFFTTKPEGEGTGLGLAVTYGIVTKYGGTIDCESTHVDSAALIGKRHGTVFTVKMPIFPEGRKA